MSFTGLWILCLAALVAPLAAIAARRLRVPSVVLEVVAGILIGSSVLGWVRIDQTITVISDIGLAMLLFMPGWEIDYSCLRGPTVELAALGMAVSLALAAVIGFGLYHLHLVGVRVFVAVVLSATGLGVLLPIFEAAPEVSGVFSRLVLIAATFGVFVPILLLHAALLPRGDRGRHAAGPSCRVRGVGPRDRARAARRTGVCARQGTPDAAAGHDRQIRIRIAVVLFIGFAALAGMLGFEAILGAFVAGAILKVVDRDAQMAHPHTSIKLEALGWDTSPRPVVAGPLLTVVAMIEMLARPGVLSRAPRSPGAPLVLDPAYLMEWLDTNDPAGSPPTSLTASSPPCFGSSRLSRSA